MTHTKRDQTFLVRLFVTGLLLVTGIFANKAILAEEEKPPVNGRGNQHPDVAKIVSGILTNNVRLSTVIAKMEETSLDSTVIKREVITSKLDNGVIMMITRDPKIVRHIDVTLRGLVQRYYSVPENSEEHINEWSFSNGVWTQYIPQIKTAWLRRSDQMAGILWMDPRDFGSIGSKNALVDKLQLDNVVESKTITASDGSSRLTVVLDRHDFEPGQARYVGEFDPARNYLPTRVAFKYHVVDIEYREVVPQLAWFPEKTTVTCYAKLDAKTPDGKGWTQKKIIETKQIRVNESLADEAFQIDLPAGTSIRDSTKFVP